MNTETKTQMSDDEFWAVAEWLESDDEAITSDEENTIEEVDSSKIPLTISNKKSELETTLIEHVNIDDINCAIKYVEDGHDMTYDSPTAYGQIELQKYKNLKTHLETYRDKIKNGMVEVDYIKPKHGYGRVHPRGGLGLMSMRRDIRNALLGDKYVDFDLANAQPEIIRNICRSNDISCPCIDKYCQNRTEVLENISECFDVEIKKAKKLMLRLCFFGTFEGWAREQGVNKQSIQFIGEFTNELNSIAKVIRTHNPILYEFARKKQERAKKNNALGCMFAFYLQGMELQIIETVYVNLRDETNLTKDSMIYENDGIKLLASNVASFGGVRDVLAHMGGVVDSLGFDTLKFEVKAIETDIILGEYMAQVLEDKEKFNDLETSQSYEAVKYRFEKDVFKVSSSACYGCHVDGVLYFREEKKLVAMYRDIKFTGLDKKGNPARKKFIHEWLDDFDKRKFDEVDAYPPHCQKPCPPNHFNLWKPFYAETIKDFEYDESAVNLFNDHVKSLCNHDEKIYEFVKMFIAHMFQRPGEKPGTCPIFVSSEGAGKGSFVAVLTEIIGRKRVIETANAKLLVGDFNSSLTGKYLVCLNELCKSQIEGNGGKLREFITDKEIQINKKGIDAVEMASYHRILGETNKKNPIKTSQGDRRFRLVPCSDEHCNDKEYFKLFYDTLLNDNAAASIFQYYMNIEGADKFREMDVPMTDHQQELQDLNASPVQIWLEQFADVCHTPIWSNKDLLNNFISWRDENGFKYELNAQALGCEIMTMGVPGIKKGNRTKSGIPKVFDFETVIKHFEKEKNYKN
jgi:putative DNA primase/helicase